MVSLGENLGEGGSVRTAVAGELLAVGLPDGDVSIAEKNIKKGETSKLPVITFIKTFFLIWNNFQKRGGCGVCMFSLCVGFSSGYSM